MNYWIAVASREHVLVGKQEGIMQVCHGKGGPIKRIKPGDWVVYYSPVMIFGEKDPCRKFTALGKVLDREPYQYQMTETFIPWRRDIDYVKDAREVPIAPLIQELSCIKNKKNWGFVFRYGLLKIPVEDFIVIADVMGIVMDGNI